MPSFCCSNLWIARFYKVFTNRLLRNFYIEICLNFNYQFFNTDLTVLLIISFSLYLAVIVLVIFLQNLWLEITFQSCAPLKPFVLKFCSGDTDHDGKLSYDEFVRVFMSLLLHIQPPSCLLSDGAGHRIGKQAHGHTLIRLFKHSWTVLSQRWHGMLVW